jgi:hypothetical protein
MFIISHQNAEKLKNSWLEPKLYDKFWESLGERKDNLRKKRIERNPDGSLLVIFHAWNRIRDIEDRDFSFVEVLPDVLIYDLDVQPKVFHARVVITLPDEE